MKKGTQHQEPPIDEVEKMISEGGHVVPSKHHGNSALSHNKKNQSNNQKEKG